MLEAQAHSSELREGLAALLEGANSALHQPLHRATGDRDSRAVERQPHLASPVHAVVGGHARRFRLAMWVVPALPP
jgi:hypothetical protein